MTASAAVARARPWQAWLLAAVCAYSVAHFVYSAILAPLGTDGADFRSIFPSKPMFQIVARWPQLAKDWIAVSSFTPTTTSWNYGPAAQWVTVPFLFIASRAHAMAVLLFIDVALAAMSWWLWVRLLFGRTLQPAIVLGLACIWLNYFPLVEALAGREIELLELWLITLAVWALRRHLQVAAGTAIGVAAMTKFLPVVLVPYLFVKGFRRAGWVAIGVTEALAAVGQWLLGFEHCMTIKLLGQEASGTLLPAFPPNHAIINVLYKMFLLSKPDEAPQVLAPHVLRPIGHVLQLALWGGCGWWVWRWRRSRLLEVEVALLMLVAVLGASHANTYYFLFALPALSVGYAAWVSQPERFPHSLKLALCSAVALSGLVVPMSLWGRLAGLPGVVVTRIVQHHSIPAFGAMFAAIVAFGVHQLLRHPATPRGEPTACGSDAVTAAAVPAA